MKAGKKRCAECGRVEPARTADASVATEVCSACGAPLDTGALSAFASRLARFGLGAAPRPILGRFPEAHDAE